MVATAAENKRVEMTWRAQLRPYRVRLKRTGCDGGRIGASVVLESWGTKHLVSVFEDRRVALWSISKFKLTPAADRAGTKSWDRVVEAAKEDKKLLRRRKHWIKMGSNLASVADWGKRTVPGVVATVPMPRCRCRRRGRCRYFACAQQYSSPPSIRLRSHDRPSLLILVGYESSSLASIGILDRLEQLSEACLGEKFGGAGSAEGIIVGSC